MAANISPGFSEEHDAGALSDINVTPLVDVTLVLLIVFMITVPAIVGVAPVKIDLPESQSVPALPPEQLPLVFSIKRGSGNDLEIYLNDRRTDEASIRKMFKDSPPSDKQPVSLSAERGLSYGEVVKIVDLLQSVGLKKLSLDTKHVESR
jgi:biopolymer transport protein TolR